MLYLYIFMFANLFHIETLLVSRYSKHFPHEDLKDVRVAGEYTLGLKSVPVLLYYCREAAKKVIFFSGYF